MWTIRPRDLPTLLAVCAALACQAPSPPAAWTGDLSVESVEGAALAALAADSAMILEDLRYLSSDEMRGRAVGSEGAALARARLAQRFAEAELVPFDPHGAHGAGSGRAASATSPDGEAPDYERAFTFTGGATPGELLGVNVVGLARGNERPDRYIVVSGHYDHEGVRGGEIYNGADDNASGAVGVAALARALNGVALRHSVIFVSFDAEEAGLQGARAFVASPPVPLSAVLVDVNMDMVARTGGVLWAGGAHHTPALRPVLEQVARRAPLELRLGHDAPGGPEGADWTGQSDHEPFHDAGIPFVYLGVDDHADYHRPTDDFDRVDSGEYMNALRTALLVVLALDRSLPFASSSLDPEPQP